MSEPLWKKYRPQEYKDIQGNNKAISSIEEWAENFEPGDTAILLDGPAGTGKTSTAEVVANEMDWAIEEVNASDSRKKEDLSSIVSLINNKPLNKDYQLTLIDEADAISGSLANLPELLKNPPNPIIFTSNEAWKIPDSITDKCEKYDFKINKRSKKSFIKKICEEEDIQLTKKEIGQLATRNDLRSIINDIQKHTEGLEVGWDDREMEVGEFDVVDNILQEKKFTGNVSPPDLVQWLEANMSSQLDGVELMRVHQALAESDKWLGKVDDTQDYSWWKYAGEIAEQTANLRLSEPYDGYIKKKFPPIRRVNTRTNKDSSEYKLYEELKESNKASFSMSCSFSEFENAILPIIESWSDEKKNKLIVEKSLSESAYSALGITKTEHKGWMEDTDFEKSEEIDMKSSENGSLFDF